MIDLTGKNIIGFQLLSGDTVIAVLEDANEKNYFISHPVSIDFIVEEDSQPIFMLTWCPFAAKNSKVTINIPLIAAKFDVDPIFIEYYIKFLNSSESNEETDENKIDTNTTDNVKSRFEKLFPNIKK